MLIQSSLRRCAASVEGIVGSYRTHEGSSLGTQKDLIRRIIFDHEVAVRRNADARAVSCTYAEEDTHYFPALRLATLPSTGGVHRAEQRQHLVQGGIVEKLREGILLPFRAPQRRRAVLYGCKSTDYLRRQLEMDDEYTTLVVGHSLQLLANMANQLVPRFGERVQFLRSEAMFTVLEVLEPSSTDVAVISMPPPFWTEKNSFQRVATGDFFSAVHLSLQARSSADDPRGMMLFTDSEPYADFAMEQLEVSKLVVPWTRKNPAQTYARWLPLPLQEHREFPQQRSETCVAVAASKSGEATSQAIELTRNFDYKRRYFRALVDQ